MSVAHARTAPRVPLRRETERRLPPRLRIVAHSEPQARRAPFFGVCVTILLGALLAALALNTSMAATAYTIRDRTIEVSQAAIAEQTLATQVEAASAPAQVMARAQTLGLVPSDGVTYLNLESMALVGGGQ